MMLVASAGWIGVDLFFVLSGFLITGLCVDHRGRGFFRAFYGRRALRILPPYLLTVAVLSLVSVIATGRAPAGVAWLLTFTTNIQVAAAGDWRAIAPAAPHLWSLAVEEQFYLLWPLLIASLSNRSTGRIAVAAIPAALVIRSVLLLAGSSPLAAYVLMPSRMDSLAIGAALAIVARDPVQWPAFARRVTRIGRVPVRLWCALLALVCLAVAAVSSGGEPTTLPMLTAGLSIVALLAGFVVVVTLTADRSSPIRTTLRQPMLLAIGRYSYAMYLFHLPVNVAFRSLGIRPSGAMQILGYAALASVVTFGFAALSWRLLERPCLELKRAFPYETVIGRDVSATTPLPLQGT
jgi:peptidoglycan/LPS O-acetylase OafA/YrhL